MRTMLRSLCILRFLMRSGGPATESFIQNGIFILQEAGGEELGCNFYLDRRGPRSREVFENLLLLQSEGKVSIEGGAAGFVARITEQGEHFICCGGQWGGHFYDLPPVRIPEKLIDSIFVLLEGDEPLKMESIGIAFYFSQTAAGHDVLATVQEAKREGTISPDIDERDIVRGYKRLKKTSLRSE